MSCPGYGYLWCSSCTWIIVGANVSCQNSNLSQHMELQFQYGGFSLLCEAGGARKLILNFKGFLGRLMKRFGCTDVSLLFKRESDLIDMRGSKAPCSILVIWQWTKLRACSLGSPRNIPCFRTEIFPPFVFRIISDLNPTNDFGSIDSIGFLPKHSVLHLDNPLNVPTWMCLILFCVSLKKVQFDRQLNDPGDRETRVLLCKSRSWQPGKLRKMLAGREKRWFPCKWIFNAWEGMSQGTLVKFQWVLRNVISLHSFLHLESVHWEFKQMTDDIRTTERHSLIIQVLHTGMNFCWSAPEDWMFQILHLVLQRKACSQKLFQFVRNKPVWRHSAMKIVCISFLFMK